MHQQKYLIYSLW